MLGSSVGIIATLWMARNTISTLSLVGYPGVLLLSFMGSATMLLPLPGMLSICGVSVLLNPITVGLLGGIGEAAGELFGYIFGYASHGLVSRRRFYSTASKWIQKRGTLVLLLMSIIPNPFFDVVGIAAGATKFPFVRFLVTVWVGKSIKSLLVAHACFYGIQSIPWIS